LIFYLSYDEVNTSSAARRYSSYLSQIAVASQLLITRRPKHYNSEQYGLF